jgi:hypothetical protein
MTMTLHFYELMMIVAREAIEIEKREEEALERARIHQELSSFWDRDCDRAANFGF